MSEKAKAKFEFDEQVGVDDGFEDTKVAINTGGAIVETKVPSRGKSGASGGLFGEADQAGAYESDGRKFTVGKFIEGEDTRYDGYSTSALNRVIVHHALRKAGLSGKRVKIATGLPVNRYYINGTPNTALIEAKRKNLLLPVRSLGGEPCAEIVEHHVFPEAFSAYIDYAADEKGQPLHEMRAPYAVVDIGGNTTDIAVLLPPDDDDSPPRPDFERCGTDDIGMMDVYKIAGPAILQAHGLDDLAQAAVRQAVQSGKVLIYGEEVDVSAIVKEAVENVSRRVLEVVERRIGRGSDIERVLFVGGGSFIMKQVVEGYKHGQVVDRADFANARGMLKYLSIME